MRHNLSTLFHREAVAVLIHGCHVEARAWETIVVGDLPHRAGRAPIGLEVALACRSNLIVWGTGASERDGIPEAQCVYNETLRQGRAVLAYLNRNVPMLHDLDDLAGFMARVSVLDTETKNTVDEIANAARLCLERGKHALVLVSSPTHIARCYQTALVWASRNPDANLTFVPVASDTSFADSGPGDVVIAEPPHRGDCPRIWLNRLLRPMFGLMTRTEPEALIVFQDMCDALKKHDIIITPETLIG